MTQEEQTFKTPLEELRRSALEHYEQVSSAAHHWNSFVEAAIKAYTPPSYEPAPPPVGQEKINNEAKHYAEGWGENDDAKSFKAGAEWMQAQLQQREGASLRWVKASDRLPNMNGDVIWRVINRPEIIGCGFKYSCDGGNFDFGWFNPHRYSFNSINEIEWLDQFTAPHPVASDAVAFLKWQTDNRYLYDYNKERFVVAWDNYTAFYTTEQLYNEFKATQAQ